MDREYTPMRDDANGYMFTPGCVRSCPHPSVIAKYGVGGVCNVSIYTCRRCQYAEKPDMIGGVICGYEKDWLH